MQAAARLCVAVTAAAVTAGAGYVVVSATEGPPPEALGPEPVTVRIDAEYSRFVPDSLRVEVGTEVRFVLMNGDPINHELIIGPESVHRRHATGTHKEHRPIPGELSVGPDEQGVTSYVFDEPGTVEMACHLPLHYEHGMHGEIEVVEPD